MLENYKSTEELVRQLLDKLKELITIMVIRNIFISNFLQNCLIN